jgi:hypothetical protein
MAFLILLEVVLSLLIPPLWVTESVLATQPTHLTCPA